MEQNVVYAFAGQPLTEKSVCIYTVFPASPTETSLFRNGFLAVLAAKIAAKSGNFRLKNRLTPDNYPISSPCQGGVPPLAESCSGVSVGLVVQDDVDRNHDHARFRPAATDPQ